MIRGAGELEELVALNEQDRAWIRETIQNANRVQGLGRLVRLLKEWSGVSAAVAILLVALTQYTTYVEFRTTTGMRLATIETRLGSLEGGLRTLNAAQQPARVMKEIASLDVKQLAQNLPALQKVSEQPFEAVHPSSEALREVIFRLRVVNEDADGYWPAVAQFLQFVSSATSDAPPPGPPDNVFDNVSMSGGMTIRTPTHAVVKLAGIIEGLTFTDDRIVLAEGVRLRNVHFVGCAFEIEGRPDPSPPPSVKQVTRELLASDNLRDAVIGGA
jgi:hypothetical protein